MLTGTLDDHLLGSRMNTVIKYSLLNMVLWPLLLKVLSGSVLFGQDVFK